MSAPLFTVSRLVVVVVVESQLSHHVMDIDFIDKRSKLQKVGGGFCLILQKTHKNKSL